VLRKEVFFERHVAPERLDSGELGEGTQSSLATRFPQVPTAGY